MFHSVVANIPDVLSLGETIFKVLYKFIFYLYFIYN